MSQTRIPLLFGLAGLLLLGCDAERGPYGASAEKSDAKGMPAHAKGPRPATASEPPPSGAAAKGRRADSVRDAVAPVAEAERIPLDGGVDDAYADSRRRERVRQPPIPRAGQLTAGRWSDRDDWSRWRRLLAPGSTYQSMLDSWDVGRLDRVAVSLNGRDRVPADAEVVIESDRGDPLWRARTDNRGRADLYLAPGRSGRLVVRAPGGHVLASREVHGSERHELRVSEDLEVAGALDLMFVVDTTGSMGDELAFLQTELTDIVARVQRDSAQELRVRTSVNFYRDRGDDYVVRSYPFTTDLSQTLGHLRSEHASGGGDFPEALDAALANAVNEHQWSDSAVARIMFVVTDAPPHAGVQVGQNLQRTTALAASKGIRIVPIASSGVDKPTEFMLRHLAVTTGGTYVFLTDHSGIGGAHIEPTVGPYVVEPLNDLLVDVIEEYTESSELRLGAPVAMTANSHRAHGAAGPRRSSNSWWYLGLGLMAPALMAGFWWHRGRRAIAAVTDPRVARARRMVDELSRRNRQAHHDDAKSWWSEMREVVDGMEQLARQQQAIDASLRVAGAKPQEADPTGMRTSLRAEVARRRATIDAEIDAGLLSVETAYLHIVGGVGDGSTAEASLDAAREALQTRIEVDRELRPGG